MKRTRVGALRHRLDIEAVARTPDGGGGATETWMAVASVWAAIEPTSGREAVTAEAVAGAITHHVTLRHRAGLAPAMRFRHGSRILEIAAVLDADERGRHLRCLCLERDL